jgi:endonuclease/exonuclease/phosphatase family metal-dependent hydrolase
MRQLRSSIIRGAITVLASGALASAAMAQTTVTINVPKTQVVYTSLRSGTYANSNQGNDLETKAATEAAYVRRAILKFDTENTIPLGSVVTSARMTVKVQSGEAVASRHIAAYQMTQSWDETQTTWNVRRTDQAWQTTGGDLGTKLGEQVVGNAAGTTVTFDVTPLVAQAVAGKLGSSRYTRIALIDMDPPNDNSRRIYYTPDAAAVANRPSLTVTYRGATSAPAPPPPPTPAPAPAPSGGATLRVLEYNVHHGGIGTDGKYDPNRIVDWIVKLNADVVSLCEMEKNDGWVATDGVALYKSLLEQKTGVTWYTWDMQDYGDWTAAGIRNAIVSKIPFVASYRHEFSVGQDRTVGGVTIAVNGRTINFASTHLDPYSGSNRATQTKELVPYLTGFAEDRIVVGDLNDQPTSTAISTIAAAYYDGWLAGKSAGVATSAPDNPNGYTRNSRIDYIFYSRHASHLTLKSIQVVDTRDSAGHMPSDHRPVLATFTVQ